VYLSSKINIFSAAKAGLFSQTSANKSKSTILNFFFERISFTSEDKSIFASIPIFEFSANLETMYSLYVGTPVLPCLNNFTSLPFN